MSFADAALQGQWLMSPGLMTPSTRGRPGGYSAGTSPLLSSPSSGALSSSSATTGPSRPLTPDGHLTCNQPSTRAKRGRAAADKTRPVPYALPPVYRLSRWADSVKNDISGGSGDHTDDFLAAEPDRFGNFVFITAAGADGKLDSFPDLKSCALPILADAHTPPPPSEASDASGTDTDPKPTMTTPSYMTLSARPLTATEYQRYRSQRRSEVPVSLKTRAANDRHDRGVLGGSRPRGGSEGCFGSRGVAGGETAAMRALGERVASRKPGSSPVFTTREEFEALPPAIQRKCFSTVERLRLTQPPNVTTDPSQVTNDFYDFSSTPLKLRSKKSRLSLAGPDPSAKQPGLRPTHHPRTLSLDSAFRSQLSRTPREPRPGPHLNRDAARDKTLSVIVDNADETSSKPESPARSIASDISACRSSAPPSPRPVNMDAPSATAAGLDRQTAEPESFFENFRFMEDIDDLDLRLQLDTFNEIPEEDETAPKRIKHRHPSFRRNFSISKINLNRSSQLSPSQPEAKDRSATPTSPPPTFSNTVSPNHSRRRSRALSLRGPRPSIAEGKTTPAASAPIDPQAAHYQDPDARLKLRVYLASPQKFDEAVEFGFPSAEAAPAKRNDEPHPLRMQQSRLELPDESGASKEQGAALADDKLSVYSDASVPEPDSPKTPEPLDRAPPRPFRPVSEAGAVKPVRHHTYSGSHSSSREMTLRMTLTRPDLRACEDQIYGWQQKGGARRAQETTVTEEAERARSPSVVYVREGSTKDSIEKQFAAMDAWAEPEKGVVKRFWDKVRRV